MIKNYLKIAFRNLLRYKAYAVINIAGLAIGMAACLMLFLVIRYELSYDKSQANYNNIYHVVTQDKYSDGITYNSGIPVPALEALRLKIPNTVFAGINSLYGSQVTVGASATAGKKFIESSGIFFCEPQFFQIFSSAWLNGNAAVLQQPNTVVLSKKIAEKYFGDWQQAMDKFLMLDNAITLKVAGIIDNPPANTDFPLGIMVSFETLKKNGSNYNYYADNWGGTSSNFQIFCLLPANTTEAAFNKQLLQFSKDNYNGRGSGTSDKSNFAVPLSDLHFDSRFDTFGDHITNKSTLKTLSLIGLFIIIMACINFINLATAQAVVRSKEVGIRKVLGSNRKQLFLQMMGETGLVVILAGAIALAISFFCLPYIKHIASIEEKLTLFNIQTSFFILAVALLVTVLAGFYPSLVLSGFKPILALKNKIASAKAGGLSLRRGLVILQFAISQVLIIGTIVAISQMNYVHHADLGFNKEAIMLLSVTPDSSAISRQVAFKDKLLQTGSIASVSFTADAPSSDNNWSTNFAYDHRADESFQVSLKFGDEDYFKTFGLQLLAGRAYDKSDTIREIVINETLVKKLGLKNAQEAIGKDIRTGRSPWKKIVGVIKDFKTNSLRDAVKPLIIAENKKYYGLTAIKIRSSNIPNTQAAIQTEWNHFFPEYAFSSAFMEENIDHFYAQENQLSLLYKIFAGLAIFICSLGLYGLVSFMAVQKIKEVGIRKVLGASVGNIIYLFSKEFTLLIIIAFLIAAPLAYFMMSSWLQSFAYRINLGAGVFILAVVISVLIAWLTVGYKALKAALVNPVKSLRSE